MLYYCLLYEYAKVDENGDFDPLKTEKWIYTGTSFTYECESAGKAAEEFSAFYHILGKDCFDDERYDVVVYDIDNKRFSRFSVNVETKVEYMARATEGEL